MKFIYTFIFENFFFLIFVFSNSKSINEESVDYETIKSLRDSVDSLNYKFDEHSSLNTNGATSSTTTANAFLTSSVSSTATLSNLVASATVIAPTHNLFRINFAELNKEFNEFDTEFNTNNWADLQSEQVSYIIFSLIFFFLKNKK